VCKEDESRFFPEKRPALLVFRLRIEPSVPLVPSFFGVTILIMILRLRILQSLQITASRIPCVPLTRCAMRLYSEMLVAVKGHARVGLLLHSLSPNSIPKDYAFFSRPMFFVLQCNVTIKNAGPGFYFWRVSLVVAMLFLFSSQLFSMEDTRSHPKPIHEIGLHPFLGFLRFCPSSLPLSFLPNVSLGRQPLLEV